MMRTKGLYFPSFCLIKMPSYSGIPIVFDNKGTCENLLMTLLSPNNHVVISSDYAL